MDCSGRREGGEGESREETRLTKGQTRPAESGRTRDRDASLITFPIYSHYLPTLSTCHTLHLCCCNSAAHACARYYARCYHIRFTHGENMSMNYNPRAKQWRCLEPTTKYKI